MSLDYLVFEVKGQPARTNIQDRDLLRRFEALDRLSEQNKTLAKEMLDLLILRNRFKELGDTTSPVS